MPRARLPFNQGERHSPDQSYSGSKERSAAPETRAPESIAVKGVSVRAMDSFALTGSNRSVQTIFTPPGALESAS